MTEKTHKNYFLPEKAFLIFNIKNTKKWILQNS